LKVTPVANAEQATKRVEILDVTIFFMRYIFKNFL